MLRKLSLVLALAALAAGPFAAPCEAGIRSHLVVRNFIPSGQPVSVYVNGQYVGNVRHGLSNAFFVGDAAGDETVIQAQTSDGRYSVTRRVSNAPYNFNWKLVGNVRP
jgi:hypothetical protein